MLSAERGNKEERAVADATESTKPVSADDAAAASEQESEARVPGPARVARGYFDALANRDVEGMIGFWAPGGVDHLKSIGEFPAPDGIRAFFTELFRAFPDMEFEVTDLVAARNQAAVRWRAKGTFCGGPFQGIEPTGARVDMEGIDLLTIDDGLIRHNAAYNDGLDLARQMGLMPPRDSATDRRMTAAFNFRTRIARALSKPKIVTVADDVLMVAGGFPSKEMNVYLIRDGDSVIVFDAGIRAMTKQIASVAAGIGRIDRVVLGHGHPDHRGAAPGLAAPVFCHPDEVADATGDGGRHYFDFSKLDFHGRLGLPRFLETWDGGPVEIAGTVSEGDEVAGFRVIHLPGHAPGLIGLWRESDRLALVSDTFYTLDPQTGFKGRPRVPHRAFNKDTEQARASIRKLAAMEPAAAWPGHADPLTGDVRSQLERAADET
jgi:glyoxylase-like metal-dependent hydrolase (beta-lactamase superfamily II)/predicted ester cyclase